MRELAWSPDDESFCWDADGERTWAWGTITCSPEGYTVGIDPELHQYHAGSGTPDDPWRLGA